MSKLMAVFGRRESGKSELIRQISYVLARTGLVYVSNLAGTTNAEQAGGWPRGYAHTIDGYRRAQRIPRLVTFPTADPEDVADIAWQAQNCTLIIDEADLICDPHSWGSEAAENIARRGRH
jgi:hypothetical protein